MSDTADRAGRGNEWVVHEGNPPAWSARCGEEGLDEEGGWSKGLDGCLRQQGFLPNHSSLRHSTPRWLSRKCRHAIEA
jgi:hypothetical protein